MEERGESSSSGCLRRFASCFLNSLTDDKVKSYLALHSNVLDEYVAESVPTETLERWLMKKQSKQDGETLQLLAASTSDVQAADLSGALPNQRFPLIKVNTSPQGYDNECSQAT